VSKQVIRAVNLNEEKKQLILIKMINQKLSKQLKVAFSVCTHISVEAKYFYVCNRTHQNKI